MSCILFLFWFFSALFKASKWGGLILWLTRDITQWPDFIPPVTMHARPAPVIALLSRSAAVMPSWPPLIITFGASSANNTAHSTPPLLRGFFFCLASAEGAGLLFCPVAICLNTSVYRGFYIIHASYTANTSKQRTELYRGFSCDYTRSTDHDTRPTEAAIIPPV